MASTGSVGQRFPGPATFTAWPSVSLLLLAAAAVVIAVLAKPWWSAIAYAAVLFLGGLLVFLQRRLAIAATKPRTTRSTTTTPQANRMPNYAATLARAGGVSRSNGSIPLRLIDKAAILGMLIASLANAAVFAQELARSVWVQ